MNQDQRRIRRFYNERYYSSEFALNSTSWHDRVVAGRLGSLHNKRVLDVACGGGTWLELLRRSGASIAGVDISDRAIASCRQRIPDADFRIASAESLPFPDGVFDLVTCLGGLEHFPDKRAALREMHRVAKPGASCLISVPIADFPGRRLGLYRGTLQTEIGEAVYSLAEWAALFHRSGFKLQTRWRDLHVVSWQWIRLRGWLMCPPRAALAVGLLLSPLRWQYQVYHLLAPTAR
jgi:ubiquinone/menaquinone biosynthesis C-methylase UbiE